jgi:hypothetical protein
MASYSLCCSTTEKLTEIAPASYNTMQPTLQSRPGDLRGVDPAFWPNSLTKRHGDAAHPFHIGNPSVGLVLPILKANLARGNQPYDGQAADKVHNARSILRDLRKPEVGAVIWSRFSQPKEQTLWYYAALAEVFRQRLPGQLAEELNEIVRALAAE